jgi:hypothetical protein
MRERATGTAKTLASLGALVLLVPLTPVPALAENGWLRQEPGSADLVGLALESGTLRPDADAGHGAASAARGEASSRRAGLAVFPPQPLDAPAEAVDVRARTDGDPGDVLTELRGGRPDGGWTEWHPAGNGRVALPHEVARVQLRVWISGGESGLTELRIRPLEEGGDPPEEGAAGVPAGGRGGDATASAGPAAPGAPEPPDDTSGAADHTGPFSATLFATRIGLVGGTTANGHRIREDDHFAALPSRRGLAVRGGGEYTVRVCTTGALGPEGRGDTENHRPRCVYLPVWDVGPWNTSDDHWNAGRETWPDLERGRPQAEAAYTLGHNGGLDGFGRRVRNPAGIDLADGAFRHGLELPTNGWVRVDYLWTGEYRWRARITTQDQRRPVVVREGPGLEYAPVGLAAHGADVDVACQTAGDVVAGAVGTDRAWYRIGEDNYVPAVSADGGDGAPACAEP